METWEKDMIAGVNRNADIKALERRLQKISKKRRNKNVRKL